jgi:hypothetical protein
VGAPYKIGISDLQIAAGGKHACYWLRKHYRYQTSIEEEIPYEYASRAVN